MLKTHTYDKINLKNLKSNFLHKTSPYTICHSRHATLHTIQPILGCQSQYFILHCRQVKQSTQNGLSVYCNLLKNISCLPSIRYDTGRDWQKNWSGLTLSLQQQSKIRLKPLFYETLTSHDCQWLFVNSIPWVVWVLSACDVAVQSSWSPRTIYVSVGSLALSSRNRAAQMAVPWSHIKRPVFISSAVWVSVC